MSTNSFKITVAEHTRSGLRSFSVIGDVYLTLFALESPKTLLGIKRIVSFLKILS